MELTLTMIRCPDTVVPEQRRVPGGDYVIGRGADASWVLPDPDRLLSKHHCVLEFRGGGWQLRDLSTNGTFINHADAPVGRDQVKMLEDGDRLRLGAYEIEVRVAMAGGQSPGAAWGGGLPAATPQGGGGWDQPAATPGWATAPAAPPPAWGGQDQGGWGAPPPRDEPLQPRLPGDPFLGAKPPGADMPGLPSGSGLPADFDPFNEGPAMPDHRPAASDAFLPPKPMQQVSVIPDNWDLGATPAAPVAPPPAPSGGASRIPDNWDIDLSPGPAGGAARPPAGPDPFAAPPPSPSAPASFAPAPGPQHPPMGDPFATAPPVRPSGPDPFAAPPQAQHPFTAPPPAGLPGSDPFAAPPPAHAAPDPFAPPAGYAPAPVAPDPYASSPAAADPFTGLAGAPPSAADPFAEPPRAVPAPPPPAVHQPAAPAQRPAAPASAGPDAGLAAFLAGAGLPPGLAATADPEATLRALGAAFHAAVAGLRQLLIARADVKREFRIEQTMLRAAGNNPVKFAASDEQALAALLTAGPQVGPRAVRETVEDLTAHQVATLAATQAAARALLARLAPEGIESTDGGGGGLFASKDKRLWEAYKRLHQQVTEQFDDDFDSAFGKEFARAYEQASRRDG
jgi:type VI secretion system FHA domain protein